MKTKRRIYHKGKTKRGGNRTKKRKDDFKPLNCSPKQNAKKYTCYSDENLHKMRDIWNARHPDKRITTNDSREIWSALKNVYSRTCNKESCWIKQMAKGTKMENDLLQAFAPESPAEWKKNPNEWLSSVDIIEVMSQYEKKYKCFEFLGPSPIDYDTHKLYGECVWEELCHFNLVEQIKKGKTKIGVIFNTDPHYKSGEHWISLFINIKKGQIFFFDSAGNEIPKNVKKFADSVIEQGNKLVKPIHFKFDQNYPIEHQYKNTECGVYSIFFIVHMLEDKITGNYLKHHVLKDEYIQKFRKIYFNEEL
uniref:Ubiquitin-like protease family profile domain-containing protein n=1 Tax=viral metagenome TaxID=1070528 RepID=A0A6C0E2H8_9ZZZZ